MRFCRESEHLCEEEYRCKAADLLKSWPGRAASEEPFKCSANMAAETPRRASRFCYLLNIRTGDCTVPDPAHEREVGPANGQATAPKCTGGRMHADVPDWSDPVCSCEAEPYWLEIGEEIESARNASPASSCDEDS